ncbi:MAG: hypothetical protein EBR30_08105 [Cytophagia bacterium]|nr:hypothetical protein [Cytophagia bacterium]
MMGTLKKLIKDKRSFLIFFLLTYLDKTISFALPLSILFILKDKSLYNIVEVSFSYASIAMVLIELGLSNYLFWGFKQAEDKELFLDKAKIYFKASLFFYCILSLLFFIFFAGHSYDTIVLLSLIAIRTLFTFYVNFHSNIFRLLDKPSKIYQITIVINILSFALLMMGHLFYAKYLVLYFLLPSFILLITNSLQFTLQLRLFNIIDFVTFLKKALLFSWPIILNTLAMTFINNYAKIYAYGYLSESEMVQISYVMRVGLIVQLTHVAFSSFFSKSLFMDESKQFNTSIFKQYSVVILSSMIFVIFLMQMTNMVFNAYIYIPIDLSTILFLIYIVLWCYIGYLELYFGVMNQNRLILYFSIVSSIVYVVLLNIYGELGLLQLGLFMVLSAVVNILLVIIGLYRLQVFGVSAQNKG